MYDYIISNDAVRIYYRIFSNSNIFTKNSLMAFIFLCIVSIENICCFCIC